MSRIEEFIKDLTDEELDAPSGAEERKTIIQGLIGTAELVAKAREAYAEKHKGENIAPIMIAFNNHIADIQKTAASITSNDGNWTNRDLFKAVAKLRDEGGALQERAR